MNLSAEKISEFQAELVACISGSGSIQDLLDIAQKEFSRPMFIKGDGSLVYAISKNYSTDVHPGWSSFLKNLDSASAEYESVRTVSEDPQFSRAFSQKGSVILKSPAYNGMVLHSNVWLNQKRICEIIVLENDIPFQPSDKELMDIFSRFICFTS